MSAAASRSYDAAAALRAVCDALGSDLAVLLMDPKVTDIWRHSGRRVGLADASGCNIYVRDADTQVRRQAMLALTDEQTLHAVTTMIKHSEHIVMREGMTDGHFGGAFRFCAIEPPATDEPIFVIRRIGVPLLRKLSVVR